MLLDIAVPDPRQDLFQTRRPSPMRLFAAFTLTQEIGECAGQYQANLVREELGTGERTSKAILRRA